MSNGNLSDKLRSTLFRGANVIAPLALTLIVFRTLYGFIENSVLGDLSAYLSGRFLPVSWLTSDGHMPGLSLLLTAFLLCALGFIASREFGKRILQGFDKIFLMLPGLRIVYSAARKALNTLGESKQSKFRKVVFIAWPATGIETLAFVTNELIDTSGKKRYVVFVPHMPNPTSGFISIVDADLTRESTTTPSEILGFGMSLGVLMPDSLLQSLDSRVHAD